MPFPLDVRYISETEKKLGATLPIDYVKRMLKENGGQVSALSDTWVLYPIFDPSDKRRLKRTCNDIVRQTQSAQEWTGFPIDAVAIGSNGCGDQLVLLRARELPGVLTDVVYWWDHETGEHTKVSDKISDLASS